LTWTWHALQAWLLKKDTEENKNGFLLIGFLKNQSTVTVKKDKMEGEDDGIYLTVFFLCVRIFFITSISAS
jgi:hypothetical protein